jgi:alkyl hydroperoxide reductase subunit D
MIDAGTTAIARDLKLNLTRILDDGALTAEEAHLALLALATATNSADLMARARSELSKLGLSPEQVQEAAESAALMGMLNTYYRFRHMLENGAEYGPARLRMQCLVSPLLGKERFEMLAFAVSVVNGCEDCIRSHETALRKVGVDVNKLHDLARLASVVKGLQALSLGGQS